MHFISINSVQKIYCRSCPYHAVKKNLNYQIKHSLSRIAISDNAVSQLKFKAQNLNLL